MALHRAYGYAAVLLACTLLLALLHHLYFYHVQCSGMKLRVAMCHMIYQKVSDGDLAKNGLHLKPQKEVFCKLDLCK